MENVIVILILLLIVSAIVIYLVRAKARGEKCVGCPYCKQCGGKCPSKSDNKKSKSADNKS